MLKANNGGNGLALGVMLASVFLMSFAPALLILGGAAEAPFLFNAFWRTGSATATLLILALFFRRYLLDWRVLGAALRSLKTWVFLGACLTPLDYGAG